MKKYYTMAAIALLLFAACASVSGKNGKLVIGPVVGVYIKEGGLYFSARVDTGAETSSINAGDIRFSNGQVEYSIVNESGKASRLTSRVVRESTVKNAESREKRYYVYLTITYMGLEKKTLVNLNHRGDSRYKLLLGRNWLSGSYLVDVDR